MEEGDAGYVDMSRNDFRSINGRRSLVNGNPRSCCQDGLLHGLKALGIEALKKDVYTDTLPKEGDTKVKFMIDYARRKYGVEMISVFKVKEMRPIIGFDFIRFKGGQEHALLQIKEGVFFVVICVAIKNMPLDKHVVVYDASYRSGTFRGAILDGDTKTPVKLLDETDRAWSDGTPSIPNARLVFRSLFPSASSVRLKHAWLMRPLPLVE